MLLSNNVCKRVLLVLMGTGGGADFELSVYIHQLTNLSQYACFSPLQKMERSIQ